MRRRLTPIVGLLAGLVTGCGVEPQDAPEALTVPSPTAASTTVVPAGTSMDSVYFVRGRRLEAVTRRSAPAEVPAALDLLTEGPTPEEVAGGLRTAVAPQSLTVSTAPARGTVTISVTRQFTGVVGGDQLLAMAQVVWTVTQFPDVERVRIRSQGQALEVPTDHGLTDQPVSRADYRSVTPLTAPSSTDGQPADGTPGSSPP